MKKLIDKEQERKIIYNYTVLNKGLKASGKEFNFSDKIVKKILLENNVPIKKVGNKRKYSINEDYFSTESSNMAYILGFWAADGNVSATENRLDLELASIDREILEKINTEIKNQRPIKIYQCANGYEKNKLLFWSENIKKCFIEYGIVPNKTYSKDFHAPFKLNKKYWIDYIRGFFDGDGCVKRTDYSLTFELNSLNKNFLIEIQKFFIDFFNIEMKITTAGKRTNTLYRLYCYGDKAKKVFEVLYTPNSLFLKRKYDKWIELIG